MSRRRWILAGENKYQKQWQKQDLASSAEERGERAAKSKLKTKSFDGADKNHERSKAIWTGQQESQKHDEIQASVKTFCGKTDPWRGRNHEHGTRDWCVYWGAKENLLQRPA
jgi:hypothetical protein